MSITLDTLPPMYPAIMSPARSEDWRRADELLEAAEEQIHQARRIRRDDLVVQAKLQLELMEDTQEKLWEALAISQARLDRLQAMVKFRDAHLQEAPLA